MTIEFMFRPLRELPVYSISAMKVVDDDRMLFVYEFIESLLLKHSIKVPVSNFKDVFDSLFVSRSDLRSLLDALKDAISLRFDNCYPGFVVFTAELNDADYEGFDGYLLPKEKIWSKGSCSAD